MENRPEPSQKAVTPMKKKSKKRKKTKKKAPSRRPKSLDLKTLVRKEEYLTGFFEFVGLIDSRQTYESLITPLEPDQASTLAGILFQPFTDEGVLVVVGQMYPAVQVYTDLDATFSVWFDPFIDGLYTLAGSLPKDAPRRMSVGIGASGRQWDPELAYPEPLKFSDFPWKEGQGKNGEVLVVEFVVPAILYARSLDALADQMKAAVSYIESDSGFKKAKTAVKDFFGKAEPWADACPFLLSPFGFWEWDDPEDSPILQEELPDVIAEKLEEDTLKDWDPPTDSKPQ